MKLILFSGFLGSGKTSAIISLAHFFQREKRDQQGMQLVVIENEIGKTDFDASRLESSNISTINMFSGCICCTLTGSLLEELLRVQTEYAPEYVVFEPTGLAYPLRIADTIHGSGIDAKLLKVVTVADATRYTKIKKTGLDLFDAQIKCADVILLSKTDLLPRAEADKIEAELKTENETAKIFQFNGLHEVQKDADEVWREVLRDESSA